MIDRCHDGLDLHGDGLFLAEPVRRVPIKVVVRPRVGLGYAGTWATKPLRFDIGGNECVSLK